MQTALLTRKLMRIVAAACRRARHPRCSRASRCPLAPSTSGEAHPQVCPVRPIFLGLRSLPPSRPSRAGAKERRKERETALV